MVAVALIFASISTICSYAEKDDQEYQLEQIEIIQVTECEPQQELSSLPDSKEDMPEIKIISQTVEDDNEIPEKMQNDFSENEKIAMGKTVYIEARGECEEGRIAIVSVILNRLKTRSAEYGAENGEVMEVITYPGAFAYPRDMTDEFFINCPEYEICMEAVEKALSGEDPTREHFPEGARHFYSLIEPLSEKEAAKREGIEIYVIGNQAFHNELN